MDVSVVIPTYKRPDLLERSLKALFSQEFDAARFEIIVADDAASAATERQVGRLSKETPIPLVYVAVTANHGPAAARNAGWKKARAPLIAFTDDDCVPDRHWLREGIEALKGSGAACASGWVRMPLPQTPTDYERSASWLASSEFVTANCFCRKDALEEVQGFDERFKTAWREDSDLQFRLLKRGFSIIQAPQAMVLHPIRPAPWGISLKQIRNNLYDALLYKKHPKLYRGRIRPLRTPSYYVIFLSAAVALVSTFMGQPGLGVPALLLWTLLTGRFCYKRLRNTSHGPKHVAEMVVTSILIPPLSVYWRLRGALKFRTMFF